MGPVNALVNNNQKYLDQVQRMKSQLLLKLLKNKMEERRAQEAAVA